jgi:hypothetical protein
VSGTPPAPRHPAGLGAERDAAERLPAPAVEGGKGDGLLVRVSLGRPLRRRRAALLATSAAVVVGCGTAVGVVLSERDRTAGLSFHGRDYIEPSTLPSSGVRRYGELVRLSGRRRGMPLYLTAREATRLRRRNEDPTILFLQRGDGSFIAYGLSGGP